MRTVLFVFSTLQNRKKYQALIQGISDYGILVNCLVGNLSNSNIEDDNYELIFLDKIPKTEIKNDKYRLLENETVKDIIDEIIQEFVLN